MFAKTIVLSDAFLDMPMSARCLYFTLGMLADDDGFINSPKGIMRQCGSSEDDLRMLVAKKFVIPFESGVVVIKHWRINNYLQKDRYNETKYIEEKETLSIDSKGAYTTSTPTASQPTYTLPVYTQDRLGKESIGKVNIEKENEEKKKRFTPPTIEEVREFIKSNDLMMVAEEFHDYYESKGWKVGNAPMKSWEAACRNWARREKKTPVKPTTSQNFTNPHTDDELDEFFRRSLERAKL